MYRLRRSLPVEGRSLHRMVTSKLSVVWQGMSGLLNTLEFTKVGCGGGIDVSLIESPEPREGTWFRRSGHRGPEGQSPERRPWALPSHTVYRHLTPDTTNLQLSQAGIFAGTRGATRDARPSACP